MTERSTRHATFVIERDYAAAPARVFAAWADAKSKARWFVGPDAWQKSDHTLDFRVGGRESVSGGPPGGPVHRYDAVYHDIVPDRRIILGYDMYLDDRRISVSLATIVLEAVGRGTTLVYTEQGVFLDGFDDPAGREHGTRVLLDNLDTALRAATD